MSENPNFLKNKYNLHTSEEVLRAKKRTESKTGEKVKEDPSSLIQNYLNRFKEITDRKDPTDREQGIEALKRVLYRDSIIKPEDIPQSYWEAQARLAREQGHGDIEITEEMKDSGAEILITDQKSSLDTWIDYMASQDATYPDWLKYFAIRSVLNLGEYDKEKKVFSKRSKGTVKPCPDLNREALAYVLDAVEKKYQKQGIDLENLNEEDKKTFDKILKEENFGKLYAFAIDKVTPTEVNLLTVTEGQWKKYDKDSDHMPLVKSLQGHGTGWCTAGESTAQTQLQGGDFYVYYSLDKDDKPTIPRAAIRMQENKIAEVRGIGPDQNLDPYIGEVVKQKMTEFSDGQLYEKKAGDMKFLTQIDKKTQNQEPLTKEELNFLYEVDEKIQGFGYKDDPRVKEIRNQRNPEQDMSIIFDCTPDQIAHNQKEVNENTKAYVGELFPNIFQTLQTEHIYTEFPEGKIRRYNIEIGGKSKKELEVEMKKQKITISSYAQDMLNSSDFATSKKAERETLIRLRVADLKTKNQTTDEIFAKAKELGLELCPPETGPQFRLQNPTQEYIIIGMKQIADRYDYPSVFNLDSDSDGLWLNGIIARPGLRWNDDSKFVFRLRK